MQYVKRNKGYVVIFVYKNPDMKNTFTLTSRKLKSFNAISAKRQFTKEFRERYKVVPRMVTILPGTATVDEFTKIFIQTRELFIDSHKSEITLREEFLTKS